MRKPDASVPIFLLVLAALAAWQARLLGVGDWSRPGPGLLPFYLGAILALVSLGLLLQSAPRDKHAKPPAEAPAETPARAKVLWTLGALAAYAFALEPAGYLLSTFFFLLFLFRAVEPRRWRVAFAAASAATVLSYALFYLLSVRLPSGLWIQ